MKKYCSWGSGVIEKIWYSIITHKGDFPAPETSVKYYTYNNNNYYCMYKLFIQPPTKIFFISSHMVYIVAWPTKKEKQTA